MFLITKEKGFDIDIYKGDTIVDGVIEVDDKTFDKLELLKLMWKNHKLVENPEYNLNKKIARIEFKISEFKNKLAATDFKAIKYFEGYYTEEEYASIKSERQGWRNEINSLEEELNQLK